MSGDEKDRTPRPPARRPVRLRRLLRLALVPVCALTAATGCAVPDLFGSDKPPGAERGIDVEPGDGARDVSESGRLLIRVPDGRLQRVTVRRTGDGGAAQVPGRISRDGLTWRPTAHRLEAAATYTVDAVAMDGEGDRRTRHTTFTTGPAKLAAGFLPEDGATVGTGMIVSLQFNHPIPDLAAVQRAVRVTADPDVELAPHWFGDQRLDFRPKERWRPGTEVTVEVRLDGVRAGPRTFGTQSETVRFRIGRDQTSVIDAARHSLTVTRQGEKPVTLPVTAGDEKNPTYNGKMVILERLPKTRMDARTVGFGRAYDIPDVPHAMRLTTSGTFLHGNYWADPDIFGDENTSHGCVGLLDNKGGKGATPAGWFYAQSLIGDIVEVVHSRDRVVAADNGLGGWNMPWEQWRAGTAL
ncbi:L,D-transpeptidase [Streptomyces catenulae]|uniref:Ig-like domain-containing protein n=1 Tax=Streptomyces catenulae TaxID=66875 RepID=A0ABV2YV19_9ACTN|nr:Ig-like domain-containing protein [Streptomyces catenulae]